MKIAFYVHCFFPDHFYGTETYTLELAKHYQAWGHEVTVISAIFQGEAKQASLVTRYEHDGIPVLAIDKNQIPHSRVKETYYQAEMCEVHTSILSEIRPDLIHVTHLINHTACLLEVANKLGIPTYATFTDFFGFCLNNKLELANSDLCFGPSSTRAGCLACHIKDAGRYPDANCFLKAASRSKMLQLLAHGTLYARKLPGLKNGPIDGLVEDIVQRPATLLNLYNRHYVSAVAPTEFLKKAYKVNHMTMPLHSIHFGVDIDRSVKPARPEGYVPVIGFIGQIAPHKGTDLLIKAFKFLPPKTASLKIYGPCDQLPHYGNQLRDLSCGYDVVFMGTFDKAEMADVLRGIDLLVIPSRWYENSPLVLLNALATHTPVLVADVEGMTEFVVDGVNGASFKRGSAEDLGKQLLDFLREPNTLAELSKTTAYERTTEVMARETFGIYTQ